MSEPDRIRYFMQHVQDYSVITIGYQEWNQLVRLDGKLTILEDAPPKLSGVMQDATVVAIAASGVNNPNPGIQITRRDMKDYPYIYNTDHYSVVERLSNYSGYCEILSRAGIRDSEKLRATVDSWVWVIGPQKLPGIHWSEEIPQYIRDAQKK
jgi:hypothetical protein